MRENQTGIIPMRVKKTKEFDKYLKVQIISENELEVELSHLSLNRKNSFCKLCNLYPTLLSI